MWEVLGTEVPQRGPGAQPLVGVRGQSRPKMGVWWRSLTYFDYLTVDLVFNFARFIKGGKIKIMNSGGHCPYRHPHGFATAYN